jgi:hypothetical protein
MKASKAAKNPTPEIEVYRDLMRLDPARRRRVAVRVLRNQKILADLYDHLLIQRSLDEPGQDLARQSYARANAPRRRLGQTESPGERQCGSAKNFCW